MALILSRELLEWISGELLGDGCLYCASPYSAMFNYSSKYPEYIHYVSDTLMKFGVERAGKIYEQYHESMDCWTFHYKSRSYREFLPMHDKWYPECKKIIPRDLTLSSIVCRQWYIGDGSITHRLGKKPSIKLATCAFPVYDVKWLVEQLGEIGILATHQPAWNMIWIRACSVKDFLSYVGECPVSCYAYKWIYQEVD